MGDRQDHPLSSCLDARMVPLHILRSSRGSSPRQPWATSLSQALVADPSRDRIIVCLLKGARVCVLSVTVPEIPPLRILPLAKA